MIELQWVLGIEMCDTQAAILSLFLNCIHGPVLQELDHYSMLTYLPLNAPWIHMAYEEPQRAAILDVHIIAQGIDEMNITIISGGSAE